MGIVSPDLKARPTKRIAMESAESQDYKTCYFVVLGPFIGQL